MTHDYTTLPVYPPDLLYLEQRTVDRYLGFLEGLSSFCLLLHSFNSAVYNTSSVGVRVFSRLTYEDREDNNLQHILIFILVLYVSIFTLNTISVS
jgi:hypothetical protein